MRTEIQGKIYIDMLMGGRDLPYGLDIFQDLSIFESVGQVAPNLSMILNDSQGQFLRDYNLTDGMPVSIRIGKTEDDPLPSFRKFRMFGNQAEPELATNHQHRFIGMYDAPIWVGSQEPRYWQGTSYSVLSQIAAESGFQFVGDGTDDTQTWMKLFQSTADFSRTVADHGYAGDSSCMVLAVTSLGHLLYKDVSKLLSSGSPRATLKFRVPVVPDNPRELQMFQVRATSRSGFFNYWMNYGFELFGPSLKTARPTIKDVEASYRETNLNQSLEVKRQLSIARQGYHAFDGLNTHPNWWRAKYQNQRLKALFTEGFSCIVRDMSGLNLLDVVDVQVGHSAVDTSPTVKSGYYMVVGKTTVIRNGKDYGERLELARNSVRNSGFNPLEG